MAVSAVGACHPCLLLNPRGFPASGSRKAHAGSVSLAWDPLFVRSSGLRLSARNGGNDGKRRIALWRASGGDEIEEERVCENVAADKGVMIKFGENLKDLMRPAVKPAMAVFLAGLLLLQPLDDAMAASGGRMGGRAFKSPPAPSRSYSGGGGGGGRAYSAPPIYGSPYGYGSPFGFSPLSPFGGGYYGGGLVLGPSIGFGGGGFFVFAMIAFVTLRAIGGFLRDRFGDRDDFDD